MENKGLKNEIVDKIKSDPILYGRIADALGVGPTSLPRILYANKPSLNQISVLKVLREHLGLQDIDLIPNMTSPAKTGKRIKRQTRQKVA